MSSIPSELKYVASHEWLQKGDDGIITVGITDHAQNALGDVVFVELPKVGSQVDVRVLKLPFVRNGQKQFD